MSGHVDHTEAQFLMAAVLILLAGPVVWICSAVVVLLKRMARR